MTSTPPATLVVCIIIVFVVLFALGVYWMFRTGRPRQPPTRPRGAVLHPDPHSFDAHDDEWEAQAPYPEHAMRAVQQARSMGQTGPDTPRFADALDPTAAESPYPGHGPHNEWEPQEDVPQDTTPTTPSRSSSVASASTLQVRCPHCLSSRIDTRNLARKAGSTIGSVAGATGGMAAALAGAETGAVVGSIAGPLGTVFGGLAGAVIAGLVGSAAGCAAGSAVGAAIDDNVLDNHLCLACGHAFSVMQD